MTLKGDDNYLYTVDMRPAQYWDISSWSEQSAKTRDRLPSYCRNWSVMGRLRERHRLNDDATSLHGPRWETIVALAFITQPADALELLEHNGEVLNLRSGSRWDLFFPGYFQTSLTNESIFLPGCMPVGHGFLSNWYFNAKDFDRMCKQVETMSQGRFIYDGRPTIMVVRATYDDSGEPSIDWNSIAFGPLSDRWHGVKTLSLNEVVYRISIDLERGSEDPNWGIAELLDYDRHSNLPVRSAATDTAIAVAGGTLATWLGRMLGMN